MIFDSNILIALLAGSADMAVARTIAVLQAENTAHVNPIIFAELSPNFATAAILEQNLSKLNILIASLELTECHRAGQAFALYRKRGGEREAILPDFLIGAQAEIRGWPIVTRDRKGFASYFPEVEIIDPYKVIND